MVNKDVHMAAYRWVPTKSLNIIKEAQLLLRQLALR